MRRLIKNAIRRLGYEVSRYQGIGDRPIDLLSLAVRQRAALGGRVFFLQVGANDGSTGDPLNGLIRRYGMVGILVEPLPDMFEKLRKTYQDQPQLQFAQVAIAEKAGHLPLYRIRPDATVPAFAHTLASFDREHLLKHRRQIPGIEALITSVEVPTMTVASLLAVHGAKAAEIDLLQVDTEGFDYHVVRMALAAEVRPAIINYEHLHLSLADRVSCRQLLASNGYQFLSYGTETLALLPEETVANGGVSERVPAVRVSEVHR